MNTDVFERNISEHQSVISSLRLLEQAVSRVGDELGSVVRAGNKMMFCGNGGSAADCQHIAAEFVGRFIMDRPPIAAVALTTDSSILTCTGNDYSFEDIFARQVSAIGRRGDALVLISTSGNSKNLIRACTAAKSKGVVTIGLLGRGGGELGGSTDFSIIVDSQSTARIQEAHILICHSLCELVELSLGTTEPKEAK